MDNFLSTARISFYFDEPDRLICAWDKTSCHPIRHEFILVKNLSDFDDHLMEHSIPPIDEVLPFLLLTKEELDAFKKPKTKREFTLSTLSEENFRNHAYRKTIKSSLDSTHGEFYSLSNSTDPSSTLKDHLTSFLSNVKINFDLLHFEQSLSVAISDLESVNSTVMKSHFKTMSWRILILTSLSILISSLSQRVETLAVILALLLVLSA